MGKKDFDNIGLFILVRNLLAGNLTISTEVDLELPRGYIAKFYRMEITWIDLHEDLEALTTTQTFGMEASILRDPDDTVITRPVSNAVQTDVLFSHSFWAAAGFYAAAADPASFQSEMTAVFDIPEHIDIISARNLRFNCRGVGAQVAILTESLVDCELHYTLERVTDADILELLDIL